MHFDSTAITNCNTKKVGVKKAFSTVATLVSIHLISMLDVIELLKSNVRSWRKKATARAPDLFVT